MSPMQKQFMVRTPEGEEFGPLDQEQLVRWAQSGRITRDCLVRNVLIRGWSSAADFAFLKPVIEAKEAEQQKEKRESLGEKIKQRITETAVIDRKLPGLSADGVFEFTPGSIPLRIGSGIFDFFIILGIGLMVYAFAALSVRVGLVTKGEAFRYGICVFYGLSLMFLAWTVGFYAQTPGQRFWGLMVVRRKGEQVFLGRAFVLAVGVFFLGWTSPFVVFILPSMRGLPELISGTRVVRTRVLRESAWRA